MAWVTETERKAATIASQGNQTGHRGSAMLSAVKTLMKETLKCIGSRYG